MLDVKCPASRSARRTEEEKETRKAVPGIGVNSSGGRFLP